MNEQDHRMLLEEILEQYINTGVLTEHLITRICFVTQPPARLSKKCSVCGELQFNTPGGITCANGHGGADSL